MTARAYGGYFDLDCTIRNKLTFNYSFQSSRAALCALLGYLNIRKIYLPKYICGVVIEAVESLDIDIEYYNIDSKLEIKDDIYLSHDSLLLYVNYFGVKDQYLDKLARSFPNDKLVFDYSQSFFAKNLVGISTIYSPRKFLPLPDGGFLNTDSILDTSSYDTDLDSIERASFLLERAAFEPEIGYQSFKAADDSLRDCIPKNMSKLTKKMFSSLELDAIRLQRFSNFSILDKRLRKYNLLDICESPISPLCFPLVVEDRKLKEELIASRVFVASYWPDVRGRISESDIFEKFFLDNLVAIPCDQRYLNEDMNYICDLVEAILNES